MTLLVKRLIGTERFCKMEGLKNKKEDYKKGYAIKNTLSQAKARETTSQGEDHIK